jgi:hypothetical protein
MNAELREVSDTDSNTTDDHCPECNEYDSECVCVPWPGYTPEARAYELRTRNG